MDMLAVGSESLISESALILRALDYPNPDLGGVGAVIPMATIGLGGQVTTSPVS